MKSHFLATLVLAGLAAVLSGCIFGSEAPPPPPPQPIKPVEIIDLDKVLNLLAETMDTMDIEQISKAGDKELEALSAPPGPAAKGPLVPAKDLNPEAEKTFLGRYVDKLNATRLWSQPIGTTIVGDGRILGFVDPNRNNQKDGPAEKELFTITLDEPRGRLVAFDPANKFYRAYNYGFPDRSLFSGYLLAAMMKRQRGAGVDAAALAGANIAPPGYHAAAVAAARKKAEAAAAAAQQQKK
ncbi:MAG: hypothetical protein LDL33_07305 [Desulfomonile sp.]|nr:hypothetical protein [Desulfomonile sp.]